MSKKELVKQEENLPAMTLSDWGNEEAINLTHFSVPKVLIMQPMSDQVTAGDAKFGELRVSDSGRLVGGLDKPMEFVPFKVEDQWIIFKPQNGKMEFDRIEKVTPENEARPWDDTDADGVAIRRDRSLVFYILLMEDLASGIALPHVISFKRTSMKAGKQLYTQMYITNRSANLPPAAYVMRLGVKKESNDKGTFGVAVINPLRRSSGEELKTAKSWHDTFKTATVVVDHADLRAQQDPVFGKDAF